MLRDLTGYSRIPHPELRKQLGWGLIEIPYYTYIITMTHELDSSSHSTHALNYHLIQCVKYRQKALDAENIIEELKERTRKLAEIYGVDIISQETDIDHIHILFRAKPNTDLTKFINNWKSSTSKALRHMFAEQLKDKLYGDSFWSDSYCLITTGQTSLETIKKYIENQGKKE